MSLEKKQKYNKSSKSPIIFEEVVAIRILQDLNVGGIRDRNSIKNKILEYDNEICKEKGIVKSSKRHTLSEATLHRFMKKYNIQTVTTYFNNLREDSASNLAKDELVAQVNHLDKYYDIKTENAYEFTTLASKDDLLAQCINDKTRDSISGFSSKIELLSSFQKIIPEGSSSSSFDIIIYQENKIKELTEISSGLSNKITPSGLLSITSRAINNPPKHDRNLYLVDPDLEKNIALHTCIRALIQVLSPVRRITEWIITNDLLILTERMGSLQVIDPFQQLANAWFWDAILKYESCENNVDKLAIIQRFAEKLKELCQKSDKYFATSTLTIISPPQVLSFSSEKQNQQQIPIIIPPAPQKIIDLIIEQHYNHFLDDVNNNEYDLPDLPFKKIKLIPPLDTKSFATVVFNDWRPDESMVLGEDDNSDFPVSNHDLYAKEDVLVEEEDLEPEVLLAELSWDRRKLNYVNFDWPQYEEDIILKSGWCYSRADKKQNIVVIESDYQMVGVIWGRQFLGDGRDLGKHAGLLLHLGCDKSPLSYVHATKRNTSSENPRQGKWFLCSGDSSFAPLQFNHDFQRVLLYMSQKKAYQPQLFVFQRVKKIIINQPKMRDLVSEDSYRSNSPVNFESYEPKLRKKANIEMFSSNKEKSLIKRSDKWISKPDLHLNSKKKIAETLDLIVNASGVSKELDDSRYFVYHSQSEYSRSHKMQKHQICEWEAYHATLKPLKKTFLSFDSTTENK